MSALYAVNTLGAVTGALLTGFVLIGSVGISRTFLIAALCNTLVGLGAIALDRFGRTVPAEPTAPPSAVAPRSSGPAIVWWVMGASGFASLALEIVWFRLMAQALDGTTYAVTVTLASVLMGIALGGAVSARLLAREGDWLAWLTVAQAATACAILFGVGLLRWDHPLGLPPQRGAVRVVALVLLPSLLMGISFPMLLRLGVPSARDAGKRGTLVGRFYSVNVLGAIGGSLASGFLIVPALGTWSAAVLLAGSFLAAAMMLALAHPRRGRALAGVAAGPIPFAWLAWILPDPFAAATRRRAPAGSVEIFRDDGVQTPVSVYESKIQRTLHVGGLHQANDSGRWCGCTARSGRCQWCFIPRRILHARHLRRAPTAAGPAPRGRWPQFRGAVGRALRRNYRRHHPARARRRRTPLLA